MKALTALVVYPRSLCLALLFVGASQSHAQSIQPGEWQYWQTEAAQAPKGEPRLRICLSSSDIKDLTVLTGVPPGDSSCKIGSIRKRGDEGVDFALDCGESGKFTATTTLSANGSVLLTQVVPVSGNLPGTKIAYVHGKKLQSCTK